MVVIKTLQFLLFWKVQIVCNATHVCIIKLSLQVIVHNWRKHAGVTNISVAVGHWHDYFTDYFRDDEMRIEHVKVTANMWVLAKTSNNLT